MSKYSYAELDSFKESLMVFSNTSSVKGASPEDDAGKTILVSRPDFNIRFIELPPVPENQIYDLLKYKIKGLYPGDPANTVFDYQVISFQGRKYAALFITRRDTSESYRHLGERHALVLPYHLMKRRLLACAAPHAGFFFWHRHWVDCIFVKEGKLASANVIKRSASPKNDFAKLARFAASRDVSIVGALFCEKEEGASLLEKAGAVFPNAALDVVDFDELFSTRLDRREALFAKRPVVALPPLSRRLAAYALLAAAFGLVIYLRVIDHLSRTRDHYQAIAQSLLERNKDLSGKLAEIKTLEKDLADLHAQKPVDYYLLLSELSKTLGAETNIQSIMIKNDAFQLEALAADPLNAEEKLRADSLFSGIAVSEMKPVPNSGMQYFRMKGTFHNAAAQ
jgi:hypothetical protein